jgi:hypothetical protein
MIPHLHITGVWCVDDLSAVQITDTSSFISCLFFVANYLNLMETNVGVDVYVVLNSCTKADTHTETAELTL